MLHLQKDSLKDLNYSERELLFLEVYKAIRIIWQTLNEYCLLGGFAMWGALFTITECGLVHIR